MEVDGNKIGIWDGVVRIICGDKAYTEYLVATGANDDKFITLNDCLELIKYDKDKDDVVIVIFDDFTHGEVYSYGNYTPKGWWQYGTTQGYA